MTSPAPRSGEKSPPLAPGGTVILVEGGDEEALIDTLRGGLTLWVAGGRESLVGRSKTLRLQAGFDRQRAVAVVLDAEESVDDALTIAHQCLRELGCTARPDHGRILDTFGRRYGIFVTPGGAARGSTETLCRAAADTSRTLCVDAFFRCAPLPAGTNTAGVDKAWIRAFCATLGPRKILRDALQTGAIMPGHPAFQPLRDFLNAL